MRLSGSFLVFLLILAYQINGARVLRVPEMVSDIQEGINAAVWGDIVLVEKGVYKEHIHIKDGVTVQGRGIDQTVIIGSGTRPVVQLFGTSTLTELTVTSSHAYPGYGVYCTRANPVIKNCKVTKAKWGVGCFLASPQIIDNEIYSNTIEGLHCIASYPTIVGNKIHNNGEGIYCCFCFSTIIKKNEISKNKYIGIYCLQSSPSISRNTIAGNDYVNILCNEYSAPSIRQNSIYDTQYYNIELYNNSQMVDARNNYWGTTIRKKILEKVWDSSDQRNLGKVRIAPWFGTEAAALTSPLPETDLQPLEMPAKEYD